MNVKLLVTGKGSGTGSGVHVINPDPAMLGQRPRARNFEFNYPTWHKAVLCLKRKRTTWPSFFAMLDEICMGGFHGNGVQIWW